MGKTAVLVDGGFYRVRAQTLWGDRKADERAKEALGLHLWGMEKDNTPFPPASIVPSKEDTENGFAIAITVYPEVVKNEMDNRRVKTNTTIPAWLKNSC